MFINKSCENFIYQNDDNGEFAIGVCNLMNNPEQNYEGNYGIYKCPLGKCKKDCYIIESLGSDRDRV